VFLLIDKVEIQNIARNFLISTLRSHPLAMDILSKRLFYSLYPSTTTKYFSLLQQHSLQGRI